MIHDASLLPSPEQVAPVEPVSTQTQLHAALLAPQSSHPEPMGALLSIVGHLEQSHLQRALIEQRTHPDSRIGELLLAEGRISEDELYRALSLKLGVPCVRLSGFDVDPQALAEIPQDVARSYRVVPLMRHQGRLVVAMNDPTCSEVLGALSVLTRATIEPVLASPGEIDLAIATHYPPFDDAELNLEGERLAGPELPPIAADTAEKLANERPIVRLVSNMLHDAIHRRASDIHIRPREQNIEILYRIDGALLHIRSIGLTLLPGLIARLKVLAAMDLGEHRLPQDGAIHLHTPEHRVDLRVSMMPSIRGESCVIRVLDPASSLRRVASIGFTPEDEKRFRELIDRNQGLVLVTGPTGSGKTTTLYAALQELNTGEYHIVTVEDPVEYRLDGIVQTQAHAAIQYGFSTALRHILRHDPDVVLIGEIRDRETAGIAVESALTGHLVLSTLHTNGAVQTITRLLEMGVESYLVSSTLAGVLAQRLAKRNCQYCREPEIVDADIRAALGVSLEETFFKGAGCPRCGGLGYHGRVAVYEILHMSPAIRAALRTRATEDELQMIAVREGMVPLTQQALALARTGEISLTEVYRSRLD
ncbi:GspE/PulE family protein [Peristeroidobacter agariperforans]|uniref:GspE/PulE family protein n=1 Tax=Peristeroidobacter agariperforans TaxID=268404 RepID=UPI00101C629E|nr:GspE/PulE family protein [Peristeroidobacter agariperforans]